MTTTTTEKSDVIRNGLNVTSVFHTLEAIKKLPSLAFFQLRARNRWVKSLQTKATIDTFYGVGQEGRHKQPFVVTADEPEGLFGEDTAPNPGENGLASLSACMTSALILKSSAMGIDLESVESEYEGDVDLQGLLGLDPNIRNGFKEIRVRFKVKGDIDAAMVAELAKTSPMYDTFLNPVPIKVMVEKI